MLKFLDDFENAPDFYGRLKIKVVLPNGNVTDCWVYMLPKYPDNLINLQYFDDYDSNGAHGLQYVTRYHRDPNDKLWFSNWNNVDHNK